MDQDVRVMTPLLNADDTLQNSGNSGPDAFVGCVGLRGANPVQGEAPRIPELSPFSGLRLHSPANLLPGERGRITQSIVQTPLAPGEWGRD